LARIIEGIKKMWIKVWWKVFYKKSRCYVRTGNNKPEEFIVTAGVKQGGILSTQKQTPVALVRKRTTLLIHCFNG
jgi:hypothetical protein